MTIREIMTRDPKTVLSTDALGNAQQEMMQLHVHHLPVMSDGKVVGMLSERDLLERRAHAEPDDRWWKQPVALAMQPPETVDAALRPGTAGLEGGGHAQRDQSRPDVAEPALQHQVEHQHHTAVEQQHGGAAQQQPPDGVTAAPCGR